MKAITQLERLKMIDKLICNECTGTPDDFAQILSISRSQLYVNLDYLKSLGLDIKYCRTKMSFTYCKPLRLAVDFTIKTIPME